MHMCAWVGTGCGAFRVSGILERITFISDANTPHAQCRDAPSLSGAGACRQTLPALPSPQTPEEASVRPAQATAGQATSLGWGLLTCKSPRHYLSKSLGRQRPPVLQLGEERTGQEAENTSSWPLASQDRWTVFKRNSFHLLALMELFVIFFPLSFSSSLSFNPPSPPPHPPLPPPASKRI